MRKRIGVFMGETPAEYQECVLKAIFAEAAKRGYDTFVFGSYGGYGDNVLYAEGEKGMLYLPDLSAFDGIIVGEDTFDIERMGDELEKLLRERAKCPVVYLRRVKEAFYSILVSSREPMAEMVRHFVYYHGFRDVCFMQGKMSYQDARERYQGFLDVMEEAGIPVTEHMVFEGDYWREKGKAAVDWFMEGRETYPQAIICSNDYMAISVCDELKRRGVRIPEDVCVSGYDNTVEARRYFPSISSVCVHFDLLGVKAVETIDRVNRGLPQQKVEFINPELVFYKSCGCSEQVYVDDWQMILQKLYKSINDVKRIVFLTTESQDAYDEEEYLRVVAKYFADTGADKGYLCMNVRTEKDDVENEGFFPEEMVLKRIFTENGGFIVCDETFPRSQILPRHILEEAEPRGYLILGIHYKNRCFGYVVMLFDDERWVDGYTQAYLSCIANVIDDAEVHEQITGLEEIRNLYQRDPLTGIYNRRGYEKRLRAIYELMGYNDDSIYIVSIDMDGLKYINDTYGHAEGDVALCRLAEVLKELLSPEEVCARVGGDEFAVVLVSEEAGRDERFVREFVAAMEKVEEKEKMPYPFRASVGVCCINQEKGTSLMGCMQKADHEMYEWKRKSKAARQNGSRGQ